MLHVEFGEPSLDLVAGALQAALRGAERALLARLLAALKDDPWLPVRAAVLRALFPSECPTESPTAAAA